MTHSIDGDRIREFEGNWKDLISKNRPQLCRSIDTEGDFIDYLEGLKVFNNRTCQSFKSMTGRYNQVSAILTALSKRPFDGFVQFCKALQMSNQEHIVLIFLNRNENQSNLYSTQHSCPVPVVTDARPDDDNSEVNDQSSLRNTWKDLIRNNYPSLVSGIDPDHGLISRLISKKVIVEWMQDTFMIKTGRSNRAAAILDHLITKRPYEDFIKFCDALKETNQTHIVSKFLESSQTQADASVANNPPVQRQPSETSQLLTPYNLSNVDWKTVFIDARNSLVDNLDASNEFINELFGFRIFNDISYDACVEKTVIERVEFILDYMRRRPDADFVNFCKALAKTNQEHVIKLLLQPKGQCQQPHSEHVQLADNTPIQASEEDTHSKELHYREECRTPMASMQGVLNQPANTNTETPRNVDIQEQENMNRPQGVICHPEDDEGHPQPVVAPTPLINLPRRHEYDERNISAAEDDSSGPVHIENVNVKPCTSEFYKEHRNDAYSIFKNTRGKCIIINIINVKNMSTRRGTETDGLLLQQLFKSLHFDVEVLPDLTAEGIKQKMNDVSRDETLFNHQCIVLFVLSHGEAIAYQDRKVDCIYGQDGIAVPVDEILEPLTDEKCNYLKDKPRLVFFQACRGDHYQTQTDAPLPPVYRDFLIGYPTQRDYRSFRNTELGTWYINALVRVFMSRAWNTSLTEMMNLVTGMVARWTADLGSPEFQNKGQTATYNSHLRKSFYFFPGLVRENRQ